MSLNWLQMSQFRVSSQTSCKYFQQKKTGFFFSLIDQIISAVFFVFIFSDLIRSHLLFCFLWIWLNISNMFSFSLNLIRSSSFFFSFSPSMWSNYLSCFFPRFINWGREKVCACQTLAVGVRKRRILKLFTFSTFWWLKK